MSQINNSWYLYFDLPSSFFFLTGQERELTVPSVILPTKWNGVIGMDRGRQ